RMPAWCDSPRLTVNEKDVAVPQLQDGFIRLQRLHMDQDVIRLKLPMRNRIGSSSDGGIYLERGPLVYSLQPKEDWTAIQMPEFEITSPDYFPMWAASAGSRWNYGLAIDRNIDTDRQVRIHKTEISAAPEKNPWVNPPMHLEVPVKRIEGWELVRPHGDDAEWFQTPPLPTNKNQLGPEESIELTPLGSTHLR